MTKKCTKIYNALAQPLFFLLNLLFSDVAVAVVVILIKLPITFYKRNEWDFVTVISHVITIIELCTS